MHRAALPSPRPSGRRPASAGPRAALVLALAVFAVVAGCTATTDIQGTPLAGSGDGIASGDDAAAGTASGSSSGAGGAGGSGCVSQRPPDLSPSTLPSCCTDGAAHCVPTQYVPPGDLAALAQCTGGYCVPDPFITNPDYIPLSCTAFNGTPGACLSLCVPQVSQYKSILTQATCAATELCAPCTNPLTQKPSGACAFAPPTTCADGGAGSGGSSGASSGGASSGGGGDDGGGAAAACPHTGPPVLDPSTLPACGTAGGAHCLQSALVPPNLASQLAACTGGYCVPDTFIEAGGNFIPPTCTSLDGAEGRCLNEVIPQVAAQASQLPQSTCAVFEKCVPCF